jgi:[NiFe] hydrogenase large subunit
MAGSKPKAAPAYTGPVIVDPVTRIEGHLRIVTKVENGKVVDVQSSSQLFRGLEIILKGRDPRDAQHFTQRSCGVCTYVHALASTRCVDNAVGVDKKLPKNATLMRNLTMAAQYMHDHPVHFYHLHALDFVDVANALAADPVKAAKIAANISPRPTKAEDLKAVQDKVKALVASGQLGIFTNAYFFGEGGKRHPAYLLPPEVDLIAVAHYLEGLRIQVKAARAMAIFGAKNPHTQFTVAGGVTNYDALKPKRLAEFAALYKEVKKFIDEVYIPDVLAVAPYYLDVAGYGAGCKNFLSFGEWPLVGKEADMNGGRWLPAGVIMGGNLGKVDPVDPAKIAEHIKHSWYNGDSALHPYQGVTEPKYTKLDDPERYSWMKAPRYMGEPMEVGPLAQVLVAYCKGQKEAKGLVDYVLGALKQKPAVLFSTLGRTAARAIECKMVADYTQTLLDELTANVKAGDTKIYEEWKMPKEAQGVGFVGCPRGGLSHWINIKGGKIENFQLVVPSTWNLGPRCGANKLGPVEAALMGTPVLDPKRPVEILRTVHSFDPCIACGVHVIDVKTNEETVVKVL